MSKELKTNILWLETFLGFLKDEGIYRQYVNNFIKYHKVNSLSETMFDCDKELLYGAFDWSKTNEGIFFWKEISQKWLMVLEKKYNKKCFYEKER